MPNVLCIADDILLVGFDEQGRDNEETLDMYTIYADWQTWSLKKISVFSDVLAFHSLAK